MKHTERLRSRKEEDSTVDEEKKEPMTEETGSESENEIKPEEEAEPTEAGTEETAGA